MKNLFIILITLFLAIITSLYFARYKYLGEIAALNYSNNELAVVCDNGDSVDEVAGAIALAKLKYYHGVTAVPYTDEELSSSVIYLLEKYKLTEKISVNGVNYTADVAYVCDNELSSHSTASSAQVKEVISNRGKFNYNIPCAQKIEVLPVKSVSTAIFREFVTSATPIDKYTAGMLLCGILLKTNCLKSKDTTRLDKISAIELAILSETFNIYALYDELQTEM